MWCIFILSISLMNFSFYSCSPGNIFLAIIFNSLSGKSYIFVLFRSVPGDLSSFVWPPFFCFFISFDSALSSVPEIRCRVRLASGRRRTSAVYPAREWEVYSKPQPLHCVSIVSGPW